MPYVLYPDRALPDRREATVSRERSLVASDTFGSRFVRRKNCCFKCRLGKSRRISRTKKRKEMWFPTISTKIYVSVVVFYSTFPTSKCRADNIPEFHWRHDDETVHIYRTEVPWTPIDFEEDKNNFAFMAWIAILSVTISVATIICLICVCWKFYSKNTTRRQSSNAALMPHAPEAVVTFHANTPRGTDGTLQNSQTIASSVYGRGIVNFAFTSSLRDPVSNSHADDGPPEYATVISQTPPDAKSKNNTPYPVVSETKQVETPPPAYITVAPFQ